MQTHLLKFIAKAEFLTMTSLISLDLQIKAPAVLFCRNSSLLDTPFRTVPLDVLDRRTYPKSRRRVSL